jgi:mono/diheme cytochrome c family protein
MKKLNVLSSMKEHCSMRSVVKIVGSLMALIILSSLAVGQEIMIGDPQSGKTIYQQHCLNCHGEKGDGHGPDIQFLTVPPANFHSLQSRSKTDWELMTVITYGVIFSPMHGWADRLTEQERWDVLSYIRQLAPFNPVT